MPQPTSTVPARNAPCPCGSGKKYKQCCALKPSASANAPNQSPRRAVIVSIAVGILAIGVVAGVLAWNQSNQPPATVPPPVFNTPDPWEYDAAKNQHWDPDHKHWHNGPPPNQSANVDSEAQVESTPTPEPWQYDPAKNRHWDPNHNHWHDGPPPPQPTTPN